MDYLRQLFGKAWSDTWDIVFNAPWATVLLAIFIFGLSTVIHWHRKGVSEVRDALVVAIEGAIATFIIFACVFAFHFLFLTPKKTNEALLAQIHPKSADGPRIKFDVADIEARQNLDHAKTELDDTRQKLIIANKEIASLKEEFRKSAIWGLTDAQFAVLSNNLKTTAVLAPIPAEEQEPFITCVMGDAGSTRFAAKLASAFKSAGWKIKGVGYSQAMFDPVPEGVIFHVHSKTDNVPALTTTLDTLRFFGIESVGYLREQLLPDHFDIEIGLKPEPPKQP
jgi:hypothetical protein